MPAFIPDYQRIADDLREQIRTGKLRPGEKLPARRQLTEIYGTSMQPVDRAIFLLISEGWILGHQGKGTFVAHVLPS